MLVPGDGRGSIGPHRLLKWLVAVTFGILGASLVVVLLHGFFPYQFLVAPMEVLAAALTASGVATIVAGILYAWGAYPQHRGAVVFVVAVTAATLLAHAYIIESPQAFAPVSASGVAGASFSGDDVRVDSTLNGQTLQVTVTPVGSDAVANLSLTSVGATLSGGAFSPAPTLSAPLEPAVYQSNQLVIPAQTATGIWTISPAGSNATITLSYLHLTCYSPDKAAYGCIMDEVYYVPVGMAMANGQLCTAGNAAPHYCKMEHPPLVPALMAVGMAVFGQYNVVGWRLFPVLLGTFSIPLLFGIAWKLSGSKKVAYLSALLLALDVMFFSMSSGGLLDVPEAFFGLAAFFAYFFNLKVWKFDRYVIAGVLLGVAGLAKESAIFMALGLLTYILLFEEGRRPQRVYSVFKVAVVVILVFSAGLQAYDSTLVAASPSGTTGCGITNTSFLQQIGYILCYGSALIAQHLSCTSAGYWCKFANSASDAPILPTDWLIFYSPVVYFSPGTVTVCPNTVNGVCKGGAYSYPIYAYYGVTNLLETWTVFVWVPLVGYLLFKQYRNKQPRLEEFGFETAEAPAPGVTQDLRFAAFALVYFLWTYVPYLGLLVAGRVTYPFYIVPAVPAVALGCAYWVSRKWFPRWLMVVFLVMVFVFFFVYFPEKQFLPDWLRGLIAH